MIEKPEPFVKPDMIFSVSDASALLKGVVETAFPTIRIRGELSGITRATSGHIYMSIKDAGAVINAIIWRSTPVPFKLEEGAEVIITGRFTTYPARSNYQIIISEIEMAGVGAILKMLEERKRKLALEGLFDASRKKPLPRLPQRIGVVTSPTGAAFQDIQNRLRERFPVHVLLYPATVQGDTAAREVANGIEYFNKMQNVDVIIVARGGGALEDLLPFSEEIVVRAAAESRIPLISGVGLAEIPYLLACLHTIVVGYPVALAGHFQQHHLHALKARSPHMAGDVGRTIDLIISNKISLTRSKLEQISKFPDILANKMVIMNQAVRHLGQMLDSLSYKNVLRRGYAIVRDNNGKIISNINEKPATVELAGGVIKL